MSHLFFLCKFFGCLIFLLFWYLCSFYVVSLFVYCFVSMHSLVFMFMFVFVFIFSSNFSLVNSSVLFLPVDIFNLLYNVCEIS